MKNLLLAIAILLLVCATAQATPVQFTTGNGNWYEVITTDTALLNWDQAKTVAEAASWGSLTDGHLATVNSSDEWTFIQGLDGFRKDLWLGGYQEVGSAEPAGGWMWVNGEGAFTFTAWRSGEPNNLNGEEALETWDPLNTWNDVGADTTNFGYIIEYENSPVPEPATMLLFGIGLLGLAGVNRRKK